MDFLFSEHVYKGLALDAGKRSLDGHWRLRLYLIVLINLDKCT